MPVTKQTMLATRGTFAPTGRRPEASIVVTLWCSLASRLEARRSCWDVMTLPDHLLKDIGVSRYDIDAVIQTSGPAGKTPWTES